jgi:hypothetical protein
MFCTLISFVSCYLFILLLQDAASTTEKFTFVVAEVRTKYLSYYVVMKTSVIIVDYQFRYELSISTVPVLCYCDNIIHTFMSSGHEAL